MTAGVSITKGAFTELLKHPEIVQEWAQREENKLLAANNSFTTKYVGPGLQATGGLVELVGAVMVGSITCGPTVGTGCALAAAGAYIGTTDIYTGLRNYGKTGSEQDPNVIIKQLVSARFSESQAQTMFITASLLTSGGASLVANNTLKITGVNPTNIKPIANTPTQTANKAAQTCGTGECFTAGTLIHTIHGLKPIETINRGELVWSREEFGDKYDYRPVIATKVTPNVPIFEVMIKHDNGLAETINTTEEHPFWIDGEGWRKASILEAGMKLLDKQGKATATIISQNALDSNETVYNFEVQDFSTYHIGEIGIWVHNAKCCDLPQGFSNTDDFEKFGANVFSHLEKQGYTDVKPIMQGSAVTGQSYRTGKAFDDNRISDFDVALASKELMKKAEEAGIGLRGKGTRTGPLQPKDLEKLGLTDMAKDLSNKYGREVNFMIYDSAEDAIKRSPSVTIKK